MDTYKNTGIKDIIAEFPKVGEILEEYGIGCGPCTVGICALKDILDIHSMAPEKEQELMTRIEAVIYPERGIKPAARNTESETTTTQHHFSAPMQLLVDEHVIIKRWLALIPVVVENIDLTSTEGKQTILDGLDLIRSYADQLHHAKEENILFKYFNDTEKIFQVIYEDHRIARIFVKEMLEALENNDAESLGQHLLAYAKLLAEHIQKEDEILFPWLDRNLTNGQIAELADKFAAEDKIMGINQKKYLSYLEKLEKRFER